MMYDIVVTYSLPQIDKLSLGANWDHGYIEDFHGHAGDATGKWTATCGAHWFAAAGYAMYDWTDTQMGALRYEYMDDTDAARTFGYSIWDLTYTHNVTVAENLMIRPEVRYIKHNTTDTGAGASEPSHGKGGGDNFTNDDETILTIGVEYVF
jgi:maltoporin